MCDALGHGEHEGVSFIAQMRAGCARGVYGLTEQVVLLQQDLQVGQKHRWAYL